MIKKIYMHNEKLKDEWLNLLHQENINAEDAIEETFGYYEDNVLIATASRYQNVIKCVAVDNKLQGGSIFNQIITHIINRNTEEGYFKHYLYTTTKSSTAFEYLGFKKLEEVDNKLVFMEKAIIGFDAFLSNLEKHKKPGNTIASIVMNANPFTLGHQFLVEKAASENDILYLFVLSEEMSVFSSATRLKLVKEGVAHLDNVYVFTTDNYMVSSATFPSYFLKEDDDVTKIQARLDAKMFVNHISKALDINIRYVGSEPFSNATNIYNEALLKEFGDKIKLVIVERLENETDVISATKVRKLLGAEKMDEVKRFVPKTTYDFLVSDAGKEIIEKLKGSTHEKP